MTLGGEYYGNYQNHDQNQRNDCQRKNSTSLSMFQHFSIDRDTHELSHFMLAIAKRCQAVNQ